MVGVSSRMLEVRGQNSQPSGHEGLGGEPLSPGDFCSFSIKKRIFMHISAKIASLSNNLLKSI